MAGPKNVSRHKNNSDPHTRILKVYNKHKDIIMAVEIHSSSHSIEGKRNEPIEVSALKRVHVVYMAALPQTHSTIVRRQQRAW